MLYEQIAQNKRKTVYVLIGFFALVLAIGGAIGYLFMNNMLTGVTLAAVLAIVYILIMISNSTNVVMQMNHAVEIKDANQYPDLWHIVEDMAMVGQIPMPRVFIVEDDSPNAFATGNDPQHAAVAVTSGIMQRLNREELEGVIAHEVSHIRNYDIRLSTIALALSAVISILVNIGNNFFWWGGAGRDRDDDRDNGGSNVIAMVFSILLMILGPLAASLAQMALSRNREYLADASGVELTRNPEGLINALLKISESEPMQAADPSSSALYISDPFKGKASHLFDSHPPIEDRVAKLRAM
ncbi:zinc metalloprotease HtpX [Latilactobacillus fuchuensis]|uniref:Protease HtpX homolog n=1 Tax=Latilactobacillus fuchuensis TaxID=164393 RepID=A0A2N9DTE5_9LACO|nr:zinc metalloprotease HtpX [Latilactobacillus fuchuensis]MCP8857259.1 zinc metalloprotease HtpX [Latilactobacillus fuchuensis]SPC36847.1 Protease HtpX homolog [Latilactobacillus fuchuensis]